MKGFIEMRYFHSSGALVALLAILTVGSLGCQNKLHDENVALHRQNRELQDELNTSNARAKTATDQSAQIEQMNRELAARDARIAELQQQLQAPSPGAAATPEDSHLLKGIEVTRDDRAGTMTVNLPGDVLFSAGSAELKPSARATLDKVIAAIRKDYGSRRVIVQGYTDPDPISKTKNKWEDNLDLSAARARAVRGYLTEHGLNSKNVGMQAYGDTVPRSSKDRSRRVEIVVATRD